MLYIDGDPEKFSEDLMAVGCFIESGNQILLLLQSLANRLEETEKKILLQFQSSAIRRWVVPGVWVSQREDQQAALAEELAREISLQVFPWQIKKLSSFSISPRGTNIECAAFRLSFPFKPEISANLGYESHVWIYPKSIHSLALTPGEKEFIEKAYQL